MKPFRFSLQPLLILRERAERQALEAYAQALIEHRRREDILKDLEGQLGEAYTESKRRLTNVTPVFHIVQHQLYCAHLEGRCKSAATDVSIAAGKVKETIEALMAARQRKEVVEKFREKQRATYDHEILVEEQKLLDELAGRRLEPAFAWRPSDHD